MIRINNSLSSFSTNKRSLLVSLRKSKNLALFSGLFLVLSTIILFIIYKFSPLVGHTVYYCQSFINAHMIPVPYYLSLIPFGLLFLILSVSLIKFLVLSIKVQILKYKLGGKTIIRSRIYELTQHLGLKEKTIIIKSEKRFAFCLGVRNPKIYISTGLISKLSEKEIEAVLRHEQYHLENHDTFTMIIASVAYSLFPLFPILSDLINKYRIEREIQADKFAVSKIGDLSPLISALKKLLAFPTFETVALASIADQDTLEPRIYSLLNKKYYAPQFKMKHIVITFVSAFILGIIIVTPVHAKEIHHDQHDVMMFCTARGECMQSCTSQENLTKLYSEIPATKKIHIENASHPYTPAQ